jgi:hypothetical protein
MSLGQLTRLGLAVVSLLEMSHTPSMHKQLNELLVSHIRGDLSRDAMRSWTYGSEGRNTWLTHAVRNADVEIVAILMYCGADPLQKCYALAGLCALEDAAHQINTAQDTQRAFSSTPTAGFM